MSAQSALTRRDIIIIFGLAALAGGVALFQSRRTAHITTQLRPHDIAIRQVIESQISAFHTQNAQAAFAYAAPDMRAKYRDAAQFMRMMRGQYRAMYHAQNISFPAQAYKIAGKRERRVQTVLIIDDKGAGFKARYLMEKQSDKTWRIAQLALQASAHRDI